MSSRLVLFLILFFAILLAGYTYYSPAVRAPLIPSLSSDGTPTTTTTGSKPAVSTSQAGKRLFENGVYVTIIEYSSKGFSPSSLTVKAGEEVRFVDVTNLTMHIIADQKNSTVSYRDFNQPKIVGKGGNYQMALVQPGAFFYYDLNSNPRASGLITVLPQ